MRRAGAALVAGSVLGFAARKTYRLLASGALTLDLDVGRGLQPLGPLTQTIRAPREVVFDVIAGPYLGKTPHALADRLQVWERGSDMALAAHFTQVKCGVTTTLETVRFQTAGPGRLPPRPRPRAASRRVVPSNPEGQRHRAPLAGRTRHRPRGDRRMVG